MGKPKAPTPPDYAAAATAQGVANSSSAVNQQQLNQVNQITPDGSLTYSTNGFTVGPDGTKIPNRTATTTLSPGQQTLYDQNQALSQSLNGLAQDGLGYVKDTANQPFDISNTPLATTVPEASQYGAANKATLDAILSRLNPELDRQQGRLDSKLANQGITQGSEAYNDAQRLFGEQRNDATQQAQIAGNAQQNQLFSQGLASANFANQTQQQNLQTQSFLRNQPLNTLNSLRTGAQIPQFQISGQNNSIGAAPVYDAVNDQYKGALDVYKSQLASFSSLLGGLGSLGSAGITAGFGGK